MPRYVAAQVLVSVLAIWTLVAPAQGQDNGWGSIKGQIIFGGDALPKPDKLDVTKDKDHCLSKGDLFSKEWIVDPKSKGVKNVYIWLETTDAKAPAIHPSLQAIKDKTLTIDQPCCLFEPYAQGMREGQTLLIKNSSPIVHNFGYAGHPRVTPGGNFILPPGASKEITDLTADRFPIMVRCDIHPWMKGTVRVFNHPYFAVTDAQGNFEIKNAPAGNLVMKVWHAPVGWLDGAAGKNGRPIAIKAEAGTDVGQLKLAPSAD